MGGEEMKFIQQAFDQNWIVPPGLKVCIIEYYK